MARNKFLAVAFHVVCWILVALPSVMFVPTHVEQTLGISLIRLCLPLLLCVAFYLNYFWLVPRYFLQRNVKVYVCVNIAIVAVSAFCMDGLVGLLHFVEMKAGFVPHPPREHVSLIAMFAFRVLKNVMPFALSVLLATLLRMALRWQKTEAARKEMEMQKTEAELKNLQNQINPHFLLNTLNNIYALISFDCDKAQKAVLSLSALLRQMLYGGRSSSISLSDDVEFIRNYVELMRLRYADTLKVSLALEPVEGELPPLLYISLLENAFKHGASSRHACYIRASFGEEEGGWLCFTVANSLLPPEERQASGRAGGVGIENLRRRLRLLYKEADYSLEVGERVGLPFGEEMLDIPAYEASLRIKTKR